MDEAEAILHEALRVNGAGPSECAVLYFGGPFYGLFAKSESGPYARAMLLYDRQRDQIVSRYWVAR